jgi:hypothetical protein
MISTSSEIARGALRVRGSIARSSQAKRLPFTDTELEQALALMDPHVGILIAILAITVRLDVVVVKALLAISLELITETSISERRVNWDQLSDGSKVSNFPRILSEDWYDEVVYPVVWVVYFKDIEFRYLNKWEIPPRPQNSVYTHDRLRHPDLCMHHFHSSLFAHLLFVSPFAIVFIVYPYSKFSDPLTEVAELVRVIGGTDDDAFHR